MPASDQDFFEVVCACGCGQVFHPRMSAIYQHRQYQSRVHGSRFYLNREHYERACTPSRRPRRKCRVCQEPFEYKAHQERLCSVCRADQEALRRRKTRRTNRMRRAKRVA